MDFDGSSQYIDLGNNSSLSPSNFTFSVWSKSDLSDGAWIAKYSSENYGFGIYSGSIYLNIKTSAGWGGLSVTASSYLTSNNWHHIVGTYDGTNLKIYVDGNLADTLAKAGPITYTSRNTRIGALEGTSVLDFTGQIDGVSIYNYALSASQITTLYGSSSTGIGNPMAISGGGKPVAYYPLGDQDAFNGAEYLVPNSSLKDYVFDFDGSNDYITISGASDLSISGDLTMSMWFKANSFIDYEYILRLGSGTTPNGDRMIGFKSSKISTNTFADSSGAYDVLGNTTLSTGVWYHVLVVYSSNTVIIYLNGNADSSAIPTTMGTISYVNTEIARGYSSRYFDGFISNVQIFNTALPATGSNSIETLYNNGSPLTSMTGFTSLQGWWKLDASATYDSSTTTWNIADSSSNSNDGTSSGMTQANLVQSDLSFTSGYSPNALDFDGTDQYISCSSSTIFQNNSNFSVSFWVNMDDYSGAGCFLMSQGTGSSNLFHIYAYGGNTIQVRLRKNNLGNGLISNIDLNNKWSNICLVYDGTKTGNSNRLKFYINKVEQTISFNQDIQSSINIGGDFLIGQQSGQSSTYTIDGQLSNISLWNNSLTASQVTEIYSEGKPSNLNNHSAVSSLISWWQLGSNSSFNTNWTVLDEKGSNNGTSANMTEVDIVDGVGSYANGLSSGMGGDEVIGDAPYSSSNSLSVNMDVEDRTTDTPS
jgi:hypothetical protein